MVNSWNVYHYIYIFFSALWIFVHHCWDQFSNWAKQFWPSLAFSFIYRTSNWGLASKQHEKIHGRNANWKAQWIKIHNLIRKISHLPNFQGFKKMTKEKTSIKGFPNKIFVSFWTFSIYRVDFQWDSRKLNNPTLSYAFFKVKTSPNSFTHNILMNCWTLFISDLIHLQFGLIEGL